MTLQQPLFILSCLQLPELSWQDPSCPFFDTVFPSFCLPLLLFLFTVLRRIDFAKPEDLEIWLNHLSFRLLAMIRGVNHILQWLHRSFCEPPYWEHGPCTKCSITFGSIRSQRPPFSSLALLPMSMIHIHTEIWKLQGSASVSSLIQEICCYLFNWASAL